MAGGKITRANRAQTPDTAGLPQPDLFALPPGMFFGYGNEQAFRLSINDAIAACGMSREDIASAMERVMGSNPEYPISKAMLDSWTAPSRTDWRMPAIYLLAFVYVTGATSIFRAGAHALGLNTFGPDDKLAAEFGKKMAAKRKLESELRSLEQQMRQR